VKKHTFLPSKLRPDLCNCGLARGELVHQVVEFDLDGEALFELEEAVTGFKVGIYEATRGGPADGARLIGMSGRELPAKAIILSEDARRSMAIALLAGLDEASEFVQAMLERVPERASYDPLNTEGEEHGER